MTTAQPRTDPTQAPENEPTPQDHTPGYETIAIPTGGRAVLVGKTGSGESVLAARLIQHWRESQPNPRVLVIDSKPRFRATHELNGLPATRRYKKWQRGEQLPHSIVLPAGVHVRDAMRQAWNLKFDTTLAQVPNLAYVDWLQAAIGWFYEDSDDKHQQLLYIDNSRTISAVAARTDAVTSLSRRFAQAGSATSPS